jgi:signal recognition particle subunit SRP54
MFASNGERLDDFDVFHPDRMASRILDMGDVLTLIEQAEKAFDRDQATEMAQKLSTGTDFTLEDFLSQMQQVRKMGSLSKLLGMLPGMGEIRDQIDGIDDRDLDRVQAIIQSMTPLERHNPKVLNASRRLRIAGGSGTTVTDVNQLVDRFFAARTMMKQLSDGMGVPGMPGLPGMPGGGRRTSGGGSKGSRKKKQKSAKRVGGRPGQRPVPSAGPAGAGVGARPDQGPAGVPALPPDFQLPKEFRDLLPPESR